MNKGKTKTKTKTNNIKFLNAKGKYYNDLQMMMTRLNLKNDHVQDENDDCLLKNEEMILCKICKIKEVMYTCPRCKIKYCSVDCYKGHGVDCTEEFYKDNVISELKATKESEEDTMKFRRNFKNVLDTLSQSTPDYLDEDLGELEQKKIEHYEQILHKLNSNEFNIESDLTPNDWKEFTSFLHSEGMDIDNKEKCGLIYFPFWLRDNGLSLFIVDIDYLSSLNEDDKKRIKDIEINEYTTYYDNKPQSDDKNEEERNEENEEEDDDYEEMPPIKTIFINNKPQIIDYTIINYALLIKYNEVKELNQLTKISPAKENLYQLIIIIYTTVYLFRLFNGEFHIENDIEVIEYMMTICPLLHDPTPFIHCHDIQSTTNHFINNITTIEGKYLKKTMRLVLFDTMNLLANKSYIFESLQRLYEINHRFGLMKNPKKVKKKSIAAKYKLIYLMSYFKSLTADMYNELQTDYHQYYSQSSYK